MRKPVVTVTMGDPAGVGPEVVLKALAHPKIRRVCHPIILGDLGILQRTQRQRRGFPIRLTLWEKGQPLPKDENTVPV